MCFSFSVRFISVSCPWFLQFDSIASFLHLATPPPPQIVLLSPTFGFMAKPCNQGCVCLCECACVLGGPPGGLLCCHYTNPTLCQCMSPRWPWLTGRGGCGSAACCHMRESAYIQCLWIKTGKYRLKKIQECLLGGDEPSALSLCRGLLCSIFQCFVVAILILNHNCGWQGRVLMRGTHLSVASWKFTGDWQEGIKALNHWYRAGWADMVLACTTEQEYAQTER